MKQQINVDLFGEHITVEATVINDAYAVWKMDNLFCIAEGIGAWELAMAIDESYMPLILEAIEGLDCKSEAHLEAEKEVNRLAERLDDLYYD